MKKEIAIRVWDTEEKAMSPPMPLTMLAGFIYGCYQRNALDSQKYLLWTQCIDKKGREIYQGDICKHNNDSLFPVSDVYFEAGSFYFRTQYLNGSCNHLEVIGNIYQNPELLKYEFP